MEEPPQKKQRTASVEDSTKSANAEVKITNGSGNDTRSRGVAPIKQEFLLLRQPSSGKLVDDDAAESAVFGGNDRDKPENNKPKNQNGGKNKGANYNRNHGTWGDKIALCASVTFSDEFSPNECQFGSKCRYEHNLRKYLTEGKVDDLKTFSVCPIFQERGLCTAGWRCRFVGSHSKEIQREDGRKELILTTNQEYKSVFGSEEQNEDSGVYNSTQLKFKRDLHARKIKLEKSDQYIKWSNKWSDQMNFKHNTSKEDANNEANETNEANKERESRHDRMANFVDPPYRPSEKRRIYYGPDTPTLAPLTTQGNLPFRRLCINLGAQFTFSEMAMGMPLIQGEKSEWALVKAHESEVQPPKFDTSKVLPDYVHEKDLRFGVQIEADKPWVAFKSAEVLSTYCPHLRVIDLNCGCPIDLVCKQGGGSALLDQGSKLEKMLRGMGAVSGSTPISCKIRMGTRDSKPIADQLVRRLILGGSDSREFGLGSSGVAAITLHGRTKQQRYTKLANWSYISEIGALIERIQKEEAEAQDTIRETDARDKPNGGKTYFLGNGDIYSQADYQEHLAQHKVDSLMIARGALIKPWIFEEIQTGQYIDKSSSERLEYIKAFVKYGLDAWGSDEKGVGTTRRFLMEWLSFAHRYVPIGLLETLPPRMNERPPPYKGRNDLETLMASTDSRDWAKIAEMFLGKASDGFKFIPKHKSNSYEIEAEG